MPRTERELLQIQEILNGEPVAVKGITQVGNDVLCLFKTTTGKAYLPYEFVKEHFPDLLLQKIQIEPSHTMAGAALLDYPASEMQQMFGAAPPPGEPNRGGPRPEDLINVRLQNQPRGKLRFKPREYQQQLFMRTLEHDTIVFLGTGLGKTLIVVMHISSPQVDRMIQEGRKVVFMAPTQDLTKQQAEYLSSHAPYRSRVYCGQTSQLGLHIDKWDQATWQNELRQVDLMFMTPQIFCSAIISNLLSWEAFSVVVFDECHHAAKPKKGKSGHPYYQLLEHFNGYYQSRPNSPRPRKIGLTASLINNQPKNAECIGSQVRAMESLMRAQCVTDTKVMEKRPRMVSHTYINQTYDYQDPIISLLTNFSKRLRAEMRLNDANKAACGPLGLTRSPEERRTLSFLNRLQLASSGFSIKPTSFDKVLGQLAAIRHWSGLWPFTHICHRLIEALENHSRLRCVHEDMRPIYVDLAAIFKHALNAVYSFLKPIDLASPESYRKLLLDYATPKSLALLDILLDEYKRANRDSKSTFSCIVFVKSRVEVVALCAWLQNVSRHLEEYAYIKCDYAIGIAATMASKWSCITKRKARDQVAMLNNFRAGLLNVIVTTSVLEEGIDLPVCSAVIRYDKAETFRVYVQSRGRARQQVSSYVSLCPNNEEFDYIDTINKFNDFEYRIKELLQGNLIGQDSRPRPTTALPASPLEAPDVFIVDDGRIRIGGSSARILLNMYCQALTKSRPYSSGIELEIRQPTRTTYQATLYLPAGCPIREGITGNEKSDRNLSANSAVVAAVKALFEAKELDEHGVPHRRLQHVEQKLIEKHLFPDMAPLDKRLEGTIIKEGERIVHEFPSKVTDVDQHSLPYNAAAQTYKLIAMQFVAEADTRDDTRSFFETARFAMVVDGSLPIDFIPKQLTGHYGKFRLLPKIIDDRLRFDGRDLHNRCFSFTHQILTRCLGIGFVDKETFRQKCLFYLVLVDRNAIDTGAMHRAFSSREYDFRVGQVVKMRKIFCTQDRSDAKKMYLVTRIHHDMNARSYVPGLGTRTFLDRFERNYRTGLQNQNQPILEVQQISAQIALTRLGTMKIDRNYTSRPLYFLRDLMEPFCDDAPLVFQSFNLPEIIYRLYFATALTDLNRKFLTDTSHRRDEILELPQEPAAARVAEDERVDINSDDEYEGGEDEFDLEDEDQDYEDEDEEVDDGEFSEDSDDTDEEFPSLQPLNMPVRKEVNLNHLDDDDEVDVWDVSQYNVPDLKTLNFDRASSPYVTRAIPSYSEPFVNLPRLTRPHEDAIIARLSMIRSGVMSDASYLDNQEELLARELKIDSAVKPPIEFDTSPTAQAGTYDLSHLFEAMTLRCSGEKYNLEVLENIGDSYLKYFVSVVLYKEMPGDPGVLSSARSSLTSNKCFNHLAKARELGAYAITRQYRSDALVAMLNGQQISNILRPKDLADLFESIVGSYLIYRNEYEAILAIEWLGLKLIGEDTFAQLNPARVAFERAPTALLDSQDAAVIEYYKAYEKRAKRIQSILNYKFNDMSYLVQAFTHASAPQKCTDSYERLEFLGDAVLDYLVVRTLTRLLECSEKAKSENFRLTPGQLTTSKSALVNNYVFAKLAVRYGYDFFIHHTNQEILVELDRVNTASKADKQLQFLEMSDYDKIAKLLGDVFEAVAGAIYLDSGCSLDAVWAVYYPMMEPLIRQEIDHPTRNVVAVLFEKFPGQDRIIFNSYSVPTDKDENVVGVRCAIYGVGEYFGEGINKKQAKLRAIQEALRDTAENYTPVEVERLNQEYIQSHRPPEGEHRGGRGQRRGAGRGRGRGGSRGPAMRIDRAQRGGHFSSRGRRPYGRRG